MDNDHNLIITPKGQYQYDSDSDIYRRVPDPQTREAWDQYGWILVTLLLTAITYYVTLV
jgi:hypothetical protein